MLCWTSLCEVILTEYFPERAVADNLTAWKRSWWDPTIWNTHSRMREQSRTRHWRDASILGLCCPLKLRHGSVFWKGGRISTVMREHLIIGYLHWSVMNKLNSLVCPETEGCFFFFHRGIVKCFYKLPWWIFCPPLRFFSFLIHITHKWESIAY